MGDFEMIFLKTPKHITSVKRLGELYVYFYTYVFTT